MSIGFLTRFVTRLAREILTRDDAAENEANLLSGNIMSNHPLSALNIDLLDSVRDRFAHDFADRVHGAIPEVSEFIEFEAESGKTAADHHHFERASQVLVARRREVQTELALIVAKRFDQRCHRLLNLMDNPSRQTLSSLSMMGDGQLEDEIVAKASGRRLKEQCEFEVWGLSQRLAILLGRQRLNDEENPVIPQILSSALMDTLASLESHAATRLVIFKAFGPVLLELVPHVYKAANEMLSSRGIDIEVDYFGRPVLAPEHAPGRSAAPGQGPAGIVGTNHEIIVSLEKLLSAVNRRDEIAASNDPDARGATRENAKTLQLPAIGTGGPAWLSRLREQQFNLMERGDSPQTDHSRTLHESRKSLHDLLTSSEQVIADLVTVAFDRLGNDARLPPRLRHVIRCLQIPVLEAALVDHALLTDNQHPARRLIDLIAEFSMTIGTDGGDGGDGDDYAIRTVENSIEGLCRLQVASPAAFYQAYCRLDDLFYHHEEAALLNDPAVSRLEKDEAMARARQHAGQELAVRLQGWTLPKPILDFLHSSWQPRMVRDFLAGGQAGAAWKFDLAVLDQLLACLQPSIGLEQRQRCIDKLGLVTVPTVTAASADDDMVYAAFRAELDRIRQLQDARDIASSAGVRFEVAPGSFEILADSVSSSEILSGMGLACGDWLDSNELTRRGRWRLNWITSTAATSILKNFETRQIWIVALDELQLRIKTGSLQKVAGVGLAEEAIKNAFAAVARHVHVPANTNENPARKPADPEALPM